jgi:putative SOS response-associated peptidase YedK
LDLEPRYNIAPTQPVAAVTLDGSSNNVGRRLEALHWGLIPFWAKDLTIGNKMINARAETLAEKPAFKNALVRRRCLIPADGFYEWKKEGRGRQPFYIRQRAGSSGDLFAFAGLWEEWRDPAASKDAPPLRSCTIITVAPNALMASIHDRMPAILRPNDEAAWLDTQGVRDPRDILALLAPYEDDALETYPVSKLVNAPANDDPECIEPLEELPPGEAVRANVQGERNERAVQNSA